MGIFPEGVNLIPFELSVLASGGEADCSAAGIDFHGNLDAAFKRVPEELPHHLDHIVVSVIVVIPKNNVVGRLPFGPTGLRVIEVSFVRNFNGTLYDFKKLSKLIEKQKRGSKKKHLGRRHKIHEAKKKKMYRSRKVQI